MPHYATADFVRAYCSASGADAELPTKGEAAAMDAMIESAERDVDRMLAPVAPADRAASGLKLDPATLEAAQVVALERAVAAAVEYRAMLGEDELVGAEDNVTGASGLTFKPTIRPPAPKAVEELAGFGFPVRSGTVAPTVRDNDACLD
jgi:hypothetical protein